METDTILDSIVFLISIMLFVSPIILSSLNQPIEIQVTPIVLFSVPIAVTLYKKRLRTQKAERQKIIDKAEKLRPLLIKLERLKNISNVGSCLTYYSEFIEERLAFLGWRRHFESQGKHLNDKFNGFMEDLDNFVNEPNRQQKMGLNRKFVSFYWLVSSFRHLYDDLIRMKELAGKDFPMDELRKIQELQKNCDDFFQSLRNLCDADAEIGSFFRGKYPFVSRFKKLTET